MGNKIYKKRRKKMRRKYVLFGSVLIFLFCLSVLMSAQSWPKNSGGVWVFYHVKGSNETDYAFDIVGRLTSGQNYVNLKNRLQKYKDRGAEYIRVWIPWSAVEKGEGVWDFSHINTIIDAIVEKGFKLDIQLCTQMYPYWYNPAQYLHYYKDDSGIVHPETDLDDHEISDRKVTSPHLSIWSTEAENRTKKLIDKSFELCLNDRADHILYVRVSLGRLNEPTYPDKEHFWHYDNHARANFTSKYPGTPFPEDPTDPNLSLEERSIFIKWYRDSKINWVKKITNYLNGKIAGLPGEQKLILYVAGDGDIYDKQDSVSCYNKYINDGWDSLDQMPQNYLRHMEFNRWIFAFCQQHNAGNQNLWFVQYAGVGETVGPNTGCAKMPTYACEKDYNGPIYAQIPTLTKNGSLINFDNVQKNICENGYWGLSWNKDSDLTNDPYSSKKLPWDKLGDMWSYLKSYNCKIPPVELVSPTHGAETNTLKPVFKWNPPNTPVTNYQIQVFKGSEIVIDEILDPVTQYQPGFKLECDTTYNWRVRAKNECGWRPWSDCDCDCDCDYDCDCGYPNFKTPGKPEAPVIIKPTGNEVTNTKKPVFKWNPAVSILPVTNYQIWIFKDDGTEIIKTQVGNVTQWQIGFPLEANERYYWKVRAYNECGWGSWSDPLAYFKTPN